MWVSPWVRMREGIRLGPRGAASTQVEPYFLANFRTRLLPVRAGDKTGGGWQGRKWMMLVQRSMIASRLSTYPFMFISIHSIRFILAMLSRG